MPVSTLSAGSQSAGTQLAGTQSAGTQSPPMLVIENVSKSFYDPGRGEVRAVDGIELHCTEGVVAVVGANGAGKSTLLRLIATLLLPDRGRVLVDGLDTQLHAEAVRGRMGYLSTTTRLYPRLTGRELLVYVGQLYGLSGAALEQCIATQTAAFTLGAFLDQRIDTLSTGQLQRINLARTLLADPPLLVLDEPTTGLDVLAAQQVIEAVRAARRPGRLILLSTHVLREVELVADRLLLIRDGRITWQGAPAELGQGEAFTAAVYAQLQS
jgi:sodium transport system ATP-binding protein